MASYKLAIEMEGDPGEFYSQVQRVLAMIRSMDPPILIRKAYVELEGRVDV